MSLLAKQVARLEAARAVVIQLERTLAVNLGLTKKGRQSGPLTDIRGTTDEELGIQSPKPALRGRNRLRVKLTPEVVVEMAEKARALFAATPGIKVRDVIDEIGTSSPTYYQKVSPAMKKLPMGAPAGDGEQDTTMDQEEKQTRDRVAQGGKKVEMAKDLGISRDTLHRRLKKFKIKV